MKNEKVELVKPHTHRGIKYQPGASLELKPRQAKRLVEIGTAKASRPLKAVDTKEN